MSRVNIVPSEILNPQGVEATRAGRQLPMLKPFHLSGGLEVEIWREKKVKMSGNEEKWWQGLCVGVVWCSYMVD